MISLPQEPKIKKEKENKAVFTVEGLYPGYGTTIGNSMRRVLLSSLEGAAITEVKIKEVPHEFSTISGVKEDVLVILLNLKEVRFKMFEEGPFEARLSVSGEKKVTASDFELPSQLEIVNGEQPIATLTDKDSSLEMEVRVERGVGYEAAEMRKKEEEGEIGRIRLDAVYTPVEKVSFRVENIRVGKEAGLERLILTLETDGRIGPEQAWREAADILRRHFSRFEIEKKKKKEKPEKKEKEPALEGREPSDIEIKELDIPSRVVGILEENRIKSVAGLVARTEENVAGMNGIGPKSLEKIKKELKKINLSLK